MLFEMLIVACLAQAPGACGNFSFKERYATEEACEASLHRNGQAAADAVVRHFLPDSEEGAAVEIRHACVPAEGRGA